MSQGESTRASPEKDRDPPVIQPHMTRPVEQSNSFQVFGRGSYFRGGGRIAVNYCAIEVTFRGQPMADGASGRRCCAYT